MIISQPNCHFNHLKDSFTHFSKFCKVGFDTLDKELHNYYLPLETIDHFLEAWIKVSEDLTKEIKKNLSDTQKILKTSFLNNKTFTNFLKLGIVSVVVNLGNISALKTAEISTSIPPKASFTSHFHSKKDAFLKLLKLTEGKTNIFILDNIGISTAYGWNPTRNSTFFNTQLAKHIGMPTNQIKAIENISIDNNIFDKNKKNFVKKVQFIPSSLKNTILTDRQIDKSAIFMMNFYEKEFLKALTIKAKEHRYDSKKAIDFYRKMPSNQEAVMIHMAYKLGTSGLLKYDYFFTNLFIYMEQPTPSNFKKISNNFTYSYKNREGLKIHDTKVEFTHTIFFNRCANSFNDITDSCNKLVNGTLIEPQKKSKIEHIKTYINVQYINVDFNNKKHADYQHNKTKQNTSLKKAKIT